MLMFQPGTGTGIYIYIYIMFVNRLCEHHGTVFTNLQLVTALFSLWDELDSAAAVSYLGTERLFDNLRMGLDKSYAVQTSDYHVD